MHKRMVQVALAAIALSGLLWLTARGISRPTLALHPAAAPLPAAATSDPATVRTEPGSETAERSPLRARRVPGKPHFTLAVKPSRGFSALNLMLDGRVLLSCRPHPASPLVGVCLLARAPDGESFTETVLVDPARTGPAGSPQGDGAWIAYAQLAAPQRIMARNLDSGEEREVGRIAGGTARSPLGPVFAVDKGRIAWIDEPRFDERNQDARIRIFDLTQHTEQILAPPPGRGTIDGLALSGGELVVSRIDMDASTDAKGDIYRSTISAVNWQRLSGEDAASMPGLAGPYVVWKRANHFSYGGIYLHDLLRERGRLLTDSSASGSPGHDMPSIGEVGVTWLTASRSQVALYRLDSGALEVFDDRGGRATTAGHYLAWVSDSISQRGDFHILWSDLSVPSAVLLRSR